MHIPFGATRSHLIVWNPGLSGNILPSRAYRRLSRSQLARSAAAGRAEIARPTIDAASSNRLNTSLPRE